MRGRDLVALVAALALALILQSLWPLGFRPLGEWPDLVLVVALLTALLYGRDPGLAAGVTAGLLMGFVVREAEFAFFLSRVAVVAVVARLGQDWHRDNAAVQFLVVLVGSLIAEAVFTLFYAAVLDEPGYLQRVGVRAGLNAVVAPLLALPLRRLRLGDGTP